MYPTLHDKDTAIVNALYLSGKRYKKIWYYCLRWNKLDKDIVKQ